MALRSIIQSVVGLGISFLIYILASKVGPIFTLLLLQEGDLGMLFQDRSAPFVVRAITLSTVLFVIVNGILAWIFRSRFRFISYGLLTGFLFLVMTAGDVALYFSQRNTIPNTTYIGHDSDQSSSPSQPISLESQLSNAVKSGDPEMCTAIQNAVYRASCISELGVKLSNPELCGRITGLGGLIDIALRDCFIGIAVKTRDPDVCNGWRKIPDPVLGSIPERREVDVEMCRQSMKEQMPAQ